MIFGTIKMMQSTARMHAARLHNIFKYFTDCFMEIPQPFYFFCPVFV